MLLSAPVSFNLSHSLRRVLSLQVHYFLLHVCSFNLDFDTHSCQEELISQNTSNAQFDSCYKVF